MNKKIVNLIAVASVIFIFSLFYWGGERAQLAEITTSTELYKPYVYRQLVPLLVRAVAMTGIQISLSLALVVTTSGLVLYVAVRELVSKFHKTDDMTESIIPLGIFVGLLLFYEDIAIYDLMTASLFALALLFMAQDQKRNYILLFPLICLNRETAILLVILYGVYKFKASLIAYQLAVYITITITLRLIFADNGGGMFIEPLQNIQRFKVDPLRTLYHFSITAAMLWMASRDWKNKPLFLRTAFIVFMPLLILEYLIVGQAFEVRVFWEVYPIFLALSIPTLTLWLRTIHEKNFYFQAH